MSGIQRTCRWHVLPANVMTGYAGHSPVLRDNQKPPLMRGFYDYRLENWGARRAAFSPYFFLSFILGSLVR